MRFSFSPLIVAALVLTSLIGSPVLASDPPKKPAAKEEPPKPKFDYIEEEGEKGRSGYVYKRVAKPKFEEPEPIPKAPFPEPPEPPKKDDHGKDGKDAKPEKLKKSPEAQRFDFNYFQMEREFLVNITGSKRVMSIQVAVMTRYDQRVIDNIKKHDLALRATILDVLRLTVDADIAKPEFRKELGLSL